VLLRADCLAVVFSLRPVQSVRGLLSSGLQVSERASGSYAPVCMSRSEKLRALTQVSAVLELYKVESLSAPYFAPYVGGGIEARLSRDSV
jgi:hypothetical protein